MKIQFYSITPKEFSRYENFSSEYPLARSLSLNYLTLAKNKVVLESADITKIISPRSNGMRSSRSFCLA
ncbi:hypothetical protein LEP1GSC047_2920 [Leptospira inadai serovar Lyme str. 10]|uniref:Uncharacterized protein n=1 Tax=Leptospira inadai serovar Lyme str. 10 TaxID=1049790 RepID=V6HBG1_9LEPT|nr:hypothetical protein LEP1GSC047_2920 [Leptospira inadai serovar Lyme str. 10]